MAIPPNPTAFPTPLNSTCTLLLGDGSGYAVQASCTGSAPTTAGTFQHGCLMYQTDTSTGQGAVFQNIGSIAVPSWSLLDTSAASFELPAAATDASTTTGTSFALTQNAITTGHGISTSVNGLTTGTGLLVAHTTSVIASGGSLIRASSTSVDTGTTTGTLLDLSSSASTASTLAKITSASLTTGKGLVFTLAGLTTGAAIDTTGIAATTQNFNMNATTGSTAAPQTNAPVGFFKIGIGGVDQWVPYYGSS